MINPLCLGIPVRYDPTFNGISESRGLLRWKEIVVGPAFPRFPVDEQSAILLHEVGHCKQYHLEKRLLKLWLAVWSPRKLLAFCAAQEFEADRFVALLGQGASLARALGRVKSAPDTLLHPPQADRIVRLLETQPVVSDGGLTAIPTRDTLAANLDRAGN